MSEHPKLFLKSKKDQPLRRFHPWVFSGAIKDVEGEPKNGEIVAIHANKGGFLGLAHYSESMKHGVRAHRTAQAAQRQWVTCRLIRKRF